MGRSSPRKTKRGGGAASSSRVADADSSASSSALKPPLHSAARAAALAISSPSRKGPAPSPSAAAAVAAEEGGMRKASAAASSSAAADKPESWLSRHHLLMSVLLAVLLIAATALVAVWVLHAAHLADGGVTAFDQRVPSAASRPIAQHASSIAADEGPVGNYQPSIIQDDISSPTGSTPSHHFVTQPYLPDPVSMMLLPRSGVDKASTTATAFDAHDAHVIEMHRIQQSIVEAQRARIDAHEASAQPSRRVQPPDHERGSGLMDANVGHIFLRSAPRARAVHAAPMINETEAGGGGAEDHSMMASGADVEFGSINSFASSAAAASTALAAPFIVHFKSSTASHAKSALSALIAPASYHVDRYVHLHNFLLVPNDSNATASSPSGIRSNEATLLRLLDSAKLGTQDGFVESWHKYEERDKIEPHLCQSARGTSSKQSTARVREGARGGAIESAHTTNEPVSHSSLCLFVLSDEHCESTPSILRAFVPETDSSTFDLTVTLFHSAASGEHHHGHTDAASAASATPTADAQHSWDHHPAHSMVFLSRATRLPSLDPEPIPELTHALVAAWSAELQRRGEPWSGISLQAEACHIVSVSVPQPFFARSASFPSAAPVDSSSAPPCFCSLLSLFASSPHTEFVEECAGGGFETHNKHATTLMQTGTYAPRPGRLHAAGLTGTGQIVSVADTGVAHGHCFFSDSSRPTPVDRVDLQHRKIISYQSIRGKTYDLPNGHGSHTAASIAGSVEQARIDQAEGEGLKVLKRVQEYNGVAPDARLSIFDVNDGLTSGKIKPPRDIYGGYYSRAYAQSADVRISSNSWGSKNGTYILECAETDRFVWDHPSFLPIFSSGNYGDRGYQSVVSPGTAKNALCVGAVANVYIKPAAAKAYYCGLPASGARDPFASAGRSSTSTVGSTAYEDESLHMARLLSYISGSGSTYDTRFKPEVLAPGHYLVSARSAGHAADDRCDHCADSLMPLFGTSMSAAVTAAAAAIARQYFTEGRYPSGAAVPTDAFVPSGALLKAVLIHSTIADTVESTPPPGFDFKELGPALSAADGGIPMQNGPTPKSGYGRIQLDSALKLQPTAAAAWASAASSTQSEPQSPLSALEMFVVDQRPAVTGDFHAYCFKVKGDQRPSATTLAAASLSPLPIRATLVWSDPPALLSAAWLLINNLDLQLSVLAPLTAATAAAGSRSRGPQPVTLVGNAHWGDASPLIDSVNNVEQISVPRTELSAGTLISVHVRGASVPQSPQPYTLVVTGAMERVSVQQCADAEAGAAAFVASGTGQLKRTAATLCPSNCSGHGSCSDDGLCACESGWGGAECDVRSLNLTLCGAPMRGAASRAKWSYFHFDVEPTVASTAGPPPFGSAAATAPAPALPSIRVQLRRLSGAPDLYLSRGRLPTLQDHDYKHLLKSADSKADADSTRDPSSSSAVSAPWLSQLDLASASAGRYFIGVYSYCCSEQSEFIISAARCDESTATSPTELIDQWAASIGRRFAANAASASAATPRASADKMCACAEQSQTIGG